MRGMLAERLLHALPRGREHAMRAQQLATLLGTDTRTLQYAVEALRKSGVLVGSLSNGGYFLIVTREDLEAGTEHIRARAIASLATYRAVKTAAAHQFGPSSLTLFPLETVK